MCVCVKRFCLFVYLVFLETRFFFFSFFFFLGFVLLFSFFVLPQHFGVKVEVQKVHSNLARTEFFWREGGGLERGRETTGRGRGRW